MELYQLAYFLAAAQTENFREAADLCHVAESAVSRQIASLERELGIPLFERRKRRVALTPVGREFGQYARRALGELQDGQQAIQLMKSGHAGTIAVGCVESLAASFLPPLFAGFHRQYPRVRMKIRVSHADDVVTRVERGDVDLGLVLDPAMDSQILIVKELFREPLKVLVPSDHRWAHKKGVTVAEVAEEPLVLLDQASRLGQICERIFSQRGLDVRPLVEVESVEGLNGLIRQGVGVTLVPSALAHLPGSGSLDLNLVPISDLAENFIFALIYRRFGTLSPSARAFVDAIQHVALTPLPPG